MGKKSLATFECLYIAYSITLLLWYFVKTEEPIVSLMNTSMKKRRCRLPWNHAATSAMGQL